MSKTVFVVCAFEGYNDGGDDPHVFEKREDAEAFADRFFERGGTDCDVFECKIETSFEPPERDF